MKKKGEGRTSVLQRTLLLPCDYLDTEGSKQTRNVHHPDRNKEGHARVNRNHAEPSESDSECDSEEEEPQIDTKDLEPFRERIEMLENEPILRETIDNDDTDVAEGMSEQSVSNLSL